MAERVAAHSVKLVLEPLNRFETYFLNTAEQARAYCDLVDHPAFGIMHVTFHSHIKEKDQAKAVATLSGHINVLHVSENDRGIPGTGQIDFPNVLGAVKRTGFDGSIVVEAFGSGVPELAAATRIWRPMFDRFECLFNESEAFVRGVGAGMTDHALFEMRGITKEFPGIRALDDVSFDCKLGQVHALVGKTEPANRP